MTKGYDKICLYEEPYVTINGEGQYIGTPAVFIRLMGCHVGCVWCDAMPTWPDPKSGKGFWYTNKELTEFIDEHCAKTPRIWMTGGEPTEHAKEVLSFIKYYKEHGKVERIFHMITAGAVFLVELMQELDAITVDIKPPSAKTKSAEDFIGWCMEDEQIRRKIDFKMVVDCDVKDINFALQQIRLLKQYNCDFTLQPMYWNDPEAKKELKQIEKDFDTPELKEVGLQMFKEKFAEPKNWKSLGEFAEHFMDIISYHNVRILTQLHKVYWPGRFDHI